MRVRSYRRKWYSVGGKCIVEKEKLCYQDSHIYSFSFYRRRKYAMRIHRHAFQLIRLIEPWKIVFRWLIVDHVPYTLYTSIVVFDLFISILYTKVFGRT